MQVVCAEDSGKFLDVGFDVVDTHAGGYGLEDDPTRGFAEWNGAGKDDTGDDQGDAGVNIVSPRKRSEPDEKRRADNAHVAERIAHDVKKDPPHVEVAVVVTVSFRGAPFFGFAVVMTCMPGVVPMITRFVARMAMRPMMLFGRSASVFHERRVLGWRCWRSVVENDILVRL